MALLPDDPLNLIGEHVVQDHLAQPGLRIRRLQKIRQLTARAADRHRRARAAPSLGIIDHGPQLCRELAVAEPRLVRGDLHGDGEEPVVFAVDMRFQQRLDLLSTGHESNPGGVCEESYPEHLHHLVAEVVDDLDRDAAGRGPLEGARGVASERRPGFLVDLGLQRGLERLVRIARAEEVGVADEEALLVVVGIDEPAGDAVGAVAADLTGVGVEDVDTVDPDLELLAITTVALDRQHVDVRLSEDDEQVPLAGVLQVAGHVQVGVHARLEDWVRARAS